jgi:penicillin amidase
MKIIRFVVLLGSVLGVVSFLNTSWDFGTLIPPFGKLLDPFHGFWQNAHNGEQPDLELKIPGLKSRVTVVYDSALVPHIYAGNDEDLFAAQGYITAQNRLWQMEFQTHAAAGRISEIVGEKALDFDRTQRRLGMVFAAENAVTAMQKNPVTKDMVESYTRGINAYISSLNYNQLPIEYKLLGYQPEPWTPLKTALLLKYMAKTLSTGEKDLEMTNALKLFGKDTLDLLYPDHEGWSDPIVDNAGQWNFKPIGIDSIPLALPNESVALQPFEKSPPEVGSNNWAVSGTKTKTGSPILCNDPHLELSLPSIWYIVHLNAPGINCMGASLPGSPNVISGFNDSIAWGVTNAQRDVVDWYKIKFNNRKKEQYESNGAWKATRKVVEVIKIKGKKDFYDTVVYTHHGPVVYDEKFHGEGEKNHFAYRWIAHDPSEEAFTFYKLNRAHNHTHYMEALNHFSAPAQNFVFASTSGDIAMRIQGKYPVRRKNEGKFVLDGSRTSQEWQAFIPNEQNIMHKNPERGFVSSANQYPADSTYPYYITASNWEAYRNRRINHVLANADNVTPQDMMKLQLDNFNLKAAESLPHWLNDLDTAHLTGAEKEAYEKMKAWDFYNHADAEGASYYEAWLKAILPMVWDELSESTLALSRPSAYITIRLLKEKPNLSFFDIQSTTEKETAQEVIRKSFSESVSTMEKWKAEKKANPRWGIYKDAIVGHLLNKMEAFSYHIEHGGNSSAVNAHSRTHGPSWRMVVSLEKTGVQAWGVYPGGQSGNPGSPYYNNLLGRWTNGQYVKLHFASEAEKMKGAQLVTITLNPEVK